MPKHRSDWNQLLTRLRAQGWRVRYTKNHLRLYGPEGQLVFCPASASDYRALRNIRAQLRNHGANL